VQRIALSFTLGSAPRWTKPTLSGALAVAIALNGSAAYAAEPAWAVPGGNAERGTQRIAQYGCPACHTIPGVKNANGNVGPPLARIGDRTYIAGMLRNTPANLVRWIREPQAVIPGNAMPDMGVSEADARDIAAYLYTLR
jgi:cytochrome c2